MSNDIDDKIDIHEPDVLLAEIRRVIEERGKLRTDHRDAFKLLCAVLDTFEPDRAQLTPETARSNIEGTDEGFIVHIPEVRVDALQARAYALDILRTVRACNDANYDARDRRTSPLPPVTCLRCGFKGYVIFDRQDGQRPTQGDDVASGIFDINGEWFIQGAYGSTHFDTSRYRFVKNFPTERVDPVCDGCFQKFIDDGDVVEVEGHFP